MRQKGSHSGNGDGLMASAKMLYGKIPRRWRWALRPLEFCYGIYDALRPRFWLAQAQPDGAGGAPVTVLCSARRSDRSYLLGQLFGGLCRETYIGRTWLWDVARILAGKGRGCCLAVVTTRDRYRRLLGRGKWLYVPSWVVGELDLPLAPDVLRAETVKSDLRRMRRSGLTFEVTRDLPALEDFYHRMYVPYITQAHGEGAVVMSYEAMKAQFPHCELLLVKKQGLAIAATLILHAPTGTRLWCIGVRDANAQFLGDGALGAAYHFAGQYVQSQGLRRMGLGLSRAFLRDGVLRYKRKLGMRLVGAAHEYFAFHVPRDTPAARTLLESMPWIFEENGALYGAVFVENGQTPLTEQDFRRLHHDFFLEGLAQVLVVPLDSGAPPAAPPHELAGRVSVGVAARLLGTGPRSHPSYSLTSPAGRLPAHRVSPS
jgi:hypothetical protein